MSVIKTIIRTRLALTSRARADAEIGKETKLTVQAAERLGEARAGLNSTVPKMPGVDEDMRSWSVLQIIEHNVIVNRAFSEIVDTIAQGLPYVSNKDPKKDVMPSKAPPFSVVEEFTESVDRYLEVAAKYPKLKGVGEHKHPVFGPMDAHQMHAMFGFHLWVHRRQAERVVKQLG